MPVAHSLAHADSRPAPACPLSVSAPPTLACHLALFIFSLVSQRLSPALGTILPIRLTSVQPLPLYVTRRVPAHLHPLRQTMIYGKKSLQVPKAIYHREKLQQTSELFSEIGAGSARSSRAHPCTISLQLMRDVVIIMRELWKNMQFLTDLIRRDAHVTQFFL